MDSAATLLAQAIDHHRQGALTEAAVRYAEILCAAPAHADALHGLAQIYCQQGRFVDGADLARRAIAADPLRARSHRLLGMALAALGRHEEALPSFDRAIALASEEAATHGSRADTLVALGRHAAAVESFERALALQPNSVADWCNLGGVQLDLGRAVEAVASFDRALDLAPDFAEAHYNRGNALARLERFEDALSAYQHALAMKPDIGGVHNNRGDVLLKLGRADEALASFEAAIALAPGDIAAVNNRAIVLLELGRADEALKCCDDGLVRAPNHAGLLFSRAGALAKLNRHSEANAGYEQVLSVDADHRYAFGALAQGCATICDWRNAAALEIGLRSRVADGRAFVSPLTAFTYALPPADLLRCSQNFVRQEIAVRPQFTKHRQHGGSERIRIAYLSSDFNSHPISQLMAELFEIHDRDRFEIVGISFGVDDGSEMRARVAKAFDRFHDVASKPDTEIARLVNETGVDIAVDLNGYTENARPSILAQRPAPIQVNYLGFLGTMGADFIDYIIADEMVVPPKSEPFCSERIIRLPDCFQVNDSTQRIAARAPTRSEAGLPERGFVFCCFNGTYKITASVFDIWMGLLRTIDDSVLWLADWNEAAAANLRREALARSVDPTRLVFAPRVALSDHLARHRLANLFLDTLPVNAGATASAALLAGLPIVTRLGNTFAGRMSASLLRAIGLPELITHSVEDYRELTLRLAREPARLGAIRRRLDNNRHTAPLFDTRRFRRHIEAAYTTMYEIYRQGESPRSFSVEPL